MEKLYIGYGREDYTPDYTVSLAGYGNTKRRINATTVDRIYASCTAITDSHDTTVLLYSVDSMNVPNEYIDPVRERVSAALDVPVDNIIVNASHSHSTPHLYQTEGAHNTQRIRDDMEKAILESGKAALADRSEAKMFVMKDEIQDLNFVKHYKLDNGTVAGDNHGNFKYATIIGHATEPDKEVRFVKFTREGKKDIVLWNWQGHPLITGGIEKTDLSADFIGAVRTRMEKEFPNMYLNYLQGCAGDMNTRSYIKEENPPQDYDAFGDLLGAQMKELLKKEMTPMEAGPIKLGKEIFMGQVNHLYDYLADTCVDIQKYFAETGDRRTANKMCYAVNFASVYHASTVLMRSKMDHWLPLEIYGFSIGNLGVVTAPNETFHKIGEEVRAKSPFDFTLTLGYTNGYRGYIPTMEGFNYGCYEADTCRYVPGIGEVLVQRQLAVLNSLKA